MFTDKRVVVTGGAGALGRAMVAHFEERGAKVAVLDYSDALLDEAFPERRDGNAYLACDLTGRESCAEAVANVIGALGGIDILCNVAGGFMMGDPVHETGDDTWDFLFNLNTRSILNMASCCGQQLRRALR